MWWKKRCNNPSWFIKSLRERIIKNIIDEIYEISNGIYKLRIAHEEVNYILNIMRYRDQYISSRKEFNEYSLYNDNKFKELS